MLIGCQLLSLLAAGAWLLMPSPHCLPLATSSASACVATSAVPAAVATSAAPAAVATSAVPAAVATSVAPIAGGGSRLFSAERAFEHLLAQCGFGPRNPGSPGHAACCDYIREVLEACGGEVRLQEFVHRAPGLPEPVQLTNIEASFGPRAPGGLLLGAHWDTRPWAERDPDPTRRDEPILGANDGASGTALLLALAETFREAPPQRPVTLVFFDGEDLGRSGYPEEFAAGARYYAAHMTADLPDFVLVVDMVASESMVLTVEETCRQYFPRIARLIDELAAEMGVPGYSPGMGPFVVDDHAPFLQMGLPTILLIDFRDPVWHTHDDTPVHCSPVSLGAVGRLVEELIRGGHL